MNSGVRISLMIEGQEGVDWDQWLALALAAEAVGLARQVNAFVRPLSEWSPDGPLTAVVCSPSAFAGLSNADRARVIGVLQSATLDGGVHLVETIVAGQTGITIDELRARYRGWAISVEREDSATPTFLARKAAS